MHCPDSNAKGPPEFMELNWKGGQDESLKICLPVQVWSSAGNSVTKHARKMDIATLPSTCDKIFSQAGIVCAMN